MDKPIEEQFAAKMNELARFLDEQFNGSLKGHARKIGFVLLVSEFGDDKRCNYIANVERESGAGMIRELLARWEAAQRN